MEDLLTMTKTKSKSVIIDGDLHYKFKMFCKGKSLKIGGVIEDLIKVYLDDPKTINKLIENYKENIE
jgi:hypothetical protein